MADSISAAAASAHSQAGPSRSSRHDMEGLGKFKLSSATPKANTYKTKFQSLRDRYEIVISTRESLSRDLQTALERLKDVQSENDLLLDAMQIVTPTQPGLVGILQQIEPDAARPQISYSVPQVVPGSQSQPVPPPGMDVDTLSSNGNANGHGHHVRTYHPNALNGHSHTRDYDRDETLEDDAMQTDRDYPAPATNGR